MNLSVPRITKACVIWFMLLFAGISWAAEQSPALEKQGEPGRQPEDRIPTSNQPDANTQSKILNRYGKLPLSFEANRGQTNEQVKFLSSGKDYTLYLTATEAVFALREPRQDSAAEQNTTAAVLRMQLIGADPDPLVEGLDRQPGSTNYIIGNDSAKWQTNIPTYAKVSYRRVYPGIDLVYYGNQHQLEYDFVVAPGTDPQEIQLAFEGADSMDIDEQGELILETGAGEMRLRKPYIYQMVDGRQQSIAGGYILDERSENGNPKNHVVGFQLAAYDPDNTLIIDPVLYATFLGTNVDDQGFDVAVDMEGNAYVTGTTESTMFPGPDGGIADLLGEGDIFIVKLDPTGSRIINSTNLGSTDMEFTPSIAVDDSGIVYLTGETSGGDVFPGPGGINAPTAGAFTNDALFVVKLMMDQNGSELLYSFVLGTGNDNGVNDIAIDSSGHVYITGFSNGPPDQFPGPQGAFPVPLLGPADMYSVIVVKLDTLKSGGASIDYSVYLGGSSIDTGHAITVDSAGIVYVTGTTNSGGPQLQAFPTTPGAYDVVCGKDDNDTCEMGTIDAFVARIDTTLPLSSQLLYSTFLGGSNNDAGGTTDFDQTPKPTGPATTGIAVDSGGIIYVTGATESDDFPPNLPCLGMPEKFLVILDPDLNKLPADQLLFANCTGSGVTVDPAGKVLVNGLEFMPPPGPNRVIAAATGQKLDASCNSYETGSTNDPAFVTAGPFGSFQSQFQGGVNKNDAFMRKTGRSSGSYAYITNSSDNSVMVIDTASNLVVDANADDTKNHIPVGNGPFGVAVTPDGSKVYVTNRREDSVSVINTAGFTVENTLSDMSFGFNEPTGIAASPDGNQIYVVNRAHYNGANAANMNGSVSVINTGDDSLDSTFSVEKGPMGIAVSPNGETLYVANQGSDSLSVIDLLNSTVNHFPLPPDPSNPVPGDSAIGPSGVAVAVTQDNAEKVYVTYGFNRYVAVFENGVFNPDLIEVGDDPLALAASPDGRHIYVTNSFPCASPGGGNSVTVIDTESDLVTGTIKLGDSQQAVGCTGVQNLKSFGISVHPDGTRLYVANELDPRNNLDGTVSVIDLTGGDVFTVPAEDVLTVPVVGNTTPFPRPIAFGQFIGPVDRDGDGIVDLVDASEDGFGGFNDDSGTPSLKFDNRHLCGTSFGEITNNPPDLDIVVESPAGLLIKATGTGTGEVSLCGGFAQMILDGSVIPEMQFACGSLTASVTSGPIEFLVANQISINVPSETKVRVNEVSAGTYEIANLRGTVPIDVVLNGQQTPVDPGATVVVTP